MNLMEPSFGTTVFTKSRQAFLEGLERRVGRQLFPAALHAVAGEAHGRGLPFDERFTVDEKQRYIENIFVERLWHHRRSHHIGRHDIITLERNVK